MTKQELIALTLKQLRDNLENHSECFELECSEIAAHKNNMSDIVIWKPKFDQGGDVIPDPNNQPRTVIVIYNKMTKELSCYIFLKDVMASQAANNSTPDGFASVCFNRLPPWVYKNFRDFLSLKRAVLKSIQHKERQKYLAKLCAVFPGTFEEDLLGKK